MKQKMIAAKPMRYANRALTAGDEFTASRRDARLLAAIGKARPWTSPPAPPVDPMDELRTVAKGLGIKVDARWGEARLRKEIEAARAE